MTQAVLACDSWPGHHQRSMLMRSLTFLLCLTISACSNEPLAKDLDGYYQVVAKCTTTTLTETVSAEADATLIVAFGAKNQEILARTAAARRATQPFVVTIGSIPNSTEELCDNVIVAETGATAAVDLALLASNGIKLPPNQVEIGTKTFTLANRAAGGTSRGAAGDAYMAYTRAQHAGILTENPETDEIHQVGMLQVDYANPWQQLVHDEIEDACSRYPQLSFIEGKAETSPVDQAKQLLLAGCRVLMIATSNQSTTKAIVAAAASEPNGPTPVIVLDPMLLDHKTCVIGCSPDAIAQAASTSVKQLLPEGGSMIFCFDASHNLVQSFCQVMGLSSERLLPR